MVSTKSSVKAHIVAGTLASPPAAAVVYNRLATSLRAPVSTLKQLGLAHTQQSVRKLERELEKLVYLKGDHQIDEARILIGHSQGGVVALLLAQSRPDLVAGVVTLGAPIHGSPLCDAHSPAAGVRCMARGSRVLGSIVRPGHCRVINIVGRRDRFVFPYRSGFLAGAEHYAFDVGHLDLVHNSAVVAFVHDLVYSEDWLYSEGWTDPSLSQPTGIDALSSA